MYRKHNDKQCPDIPLTSPSPEFGSDLGTGDESSSEGTPPSSDFDFDAEKKRQEAMFILKAKEERMITQKALDGMLKHVQS